MRVAVKWADLFSVFTADGHADSPDLTPVYNMPELFPQDDFEVSSMFGSGSQKDKLQAKYSKLMQEAQALSTVNRKKSDLKRAEAEEIGRQLDELEKQT